MRPAVSSRSLDDWLAWLETLSPHEIDLGLSRIEQVLGRLELRRPARVITVAGTNGKGSCVVMLEALLASAGEKTGCYTSPHMHAFNERIRIDGRAVSDLDIVTAFRRIEKVRDGTPLTYFEYGTLAALLVFDAVRPDTVILEVGLGGRLDAVNAVDADACLITNVTLDHCDWLGADVESIAVEKAGIMRGDTPVVFGSSTVPKAITVKAAAIAADLFVAGRDFSVIVDSGGNEWAWRGRQAIVEGLKKPSLEGRHQIQNAAAVLAVIESLGLDEILNAGLINGALAQIELCGRLQRVDIAESAFVLDVAHNVDSARILRDYLAGVTDIDRVIAVVGMQEGKDSGGMIAKLAPVVHRWIACRTDSTNAVGADELARRIVQGSGRPCRIAASVEEALEAALSVAQRAATKTDLILITGSFHTVGPALRWLDDFRCAR